MTADRARHRAPLGPPLLARLNRPTPVKLAALSLTVAGLGTLGTVSGLGVMAAPQAKATTTAVVPPLPRTPEPTGRGGPLAPIFTVTDAPHYEPEPPPTATRPSRSQRAIPAQRPVIATSAPSRAEPPVPDIPATPEPAPAPPAPAEPAPVELPVEPEAPLIEEDEVTEPPALPEVVDETTEIETDPLAEEAS